MTRTHLHRHAMHQTITPLHAALVYATHGWPVLPLHTPRTDGCSCQQPDCSSPGKHPRIRGGAHNATTDLDRIEHWWRRWPDANVAILTDALLVLDVDGPPGEAQLQRLEQCHEPLPPTAHIQTGRGRHLYYAAGHEPPLRNVALGPNLHVRARGGYAVAPPSRHANGATYRWMDTGALAPVPAWLAAAAAPDPRPRPSSPVPALRDARGRGYLHAALARELADVIAAPRGRRNITLNRAAFRLGQLAGAGLSDQPDLAQPLLAAALAVGLSEREARATIASGLGAGSRHPRAVRQRVREPVQRQ